MDWNMGVDCVIMCRATNCIFEVKTRYNNPVVQVLKKKTKKQTVCENMEKIKKKLKDIHKNIKKQN